MQSSSNIDLSLGAWAAAILGAAISLQFVNDLNWKQKLTMLVTGTAISIVITPAVIEIVDMPHGALTNGLAFLVGMFGWAIAGAIIISIRKADVWLLFSDIVKKLFGRS